MNHHWALDQVGCPYVLVSHTISELWLCDKKVTLSAFIKAPRPLSSSKRQQTTWQQPGRDAVSMSLLYMEVSWMWMPAWLLFDQNLQCELQQQTLGSGLKWLALVIFHLPSSWLLPSWLETENDFTTLLWTLGWDDGLLLHLMEYSRTWMKYWILNEMPAACPAM